MQVKTVDLYDYFGVKKPENAVGLLHCYVIGRYSYCKERVRPGILIITGGGYGCCAKTSMEPVALEYMAKGFNAYTLEYTCNVAFPMPLVEAGMAMAYIRKEAENHCTMPDKIASIGFSAGGHLNGMLGTMYDCEEIKSAIGDIDAKPNALLFGYSVITSGEYTHAGSIKTISGGDSELAKKLSVENLVTENTPPVFIWSTAGDTVVPCENSLKLALACRKHKVPVELHIFEYGEHGLSLCKQESALNLVTSPRLDHFKHARPWFELSVRWLVSHGYEINV